MLNDLGNKIHKNRKCVFTTLVKGCSMCNKHKFKEIKHKQ